MKLLYPELLFLLFLIPLFLYHKEGKKVYISKKIVLNRENSKLKLYFLVGSIIFMIFSISRPVSDKKEINIKSKLPTIAIAIDSSKSMFAKDVYPNRYEFAKIKAKKLVDKLNGKIAVFVFSNQVSLLSPPTDDKETLKEMITNIPNDMLNTKGTSINMVIKTVKSLGIKNLIILSDGGSKKEINSDGINLFSLIIATKKGSPIYDKKGEFIKDKNGKIVISSANENLIRESKFGVNYTLNDSDINSIAKQNFKGEKESDNKIYIYNELFYYPLIIALILFFMAIFSFPKHKNSALLFFLMFLPSYEARAAMLDFYEVNQANKLYRSGKYQEAIKKYNSVKTDDKLLKSRIFYNESNAFDKLKKDDEAIKLLKEAQKLNPKDKDIENNLKELLKRKKKKEKQSKQNKNNSSKNKQNNKQNKQNKNKQENPNNKENKHNKNKQDRNNQKLSQKKVDKNRDNQQKDKFKKDENKDKNKSKSESKSKNSITKKSLKEREKNSIHIQVNPDKSILDRVKTPSILYPLNSYKPKGDSDEW